MSKMTVIQLLNKISNTKDYKDIPKKVKITTGSLKEEYRIWVWDGLWYVYEEDGEDVCICTEKLDLNDKVEIIEEEKKIDKLKIKPLNERDDLQRQIEVAHYENVMIANAVNEIIDKINKGEE